LIFEASNPGFGIPGIVGAVCICVALYAFQVLPVSYAGLALMLLGIILMTTEAFAPVFWGIRFRRDCRFCHRLDYFDGH
jgi:membrane-bound serine protease (ClpP class)